MPIISSTIKSIARGSSRIQCLRTPTSVLRHNIASYPALRSARVNNSVSAKRYYPVSLALIEDIEEYRPGGYHPVHIGDVFHARYKVLHKLGAGGFSTTWLARDTICKTHVALKILKAEETTTYSELRMLQRLASLPGNHPGRRHVRTVLDNFVIEGPNALHNCLVTEVAGPSLNDLYNVPGIGYTAGARRLRAGLAHKVISQISEAVDFLHSNRVCPGGMLAKRLRTGDLKQWTDVLRRFDFTKPAFEAQINR
jgi:serine/threonine protein kinase